MAVKLADLKRDRRTINIPIQTGQDESTGEDLFDMLVVTYRPSAYTANTELVFNEKLAGDWKSEMGLAFVMTLVVNWDLEVEDGTPYPLDQDSLAELPSPFIGAVIGGIAEDMGKAAAPSNGS